MSASAASREAFLATIRKACPPGLWSQGVGFSRAGAVTLSEEGTGEATLRVRERGRAVAATVTLYLEDAEWTCDCESRAACCAHAAAAAIAYAQGPSPAGVAADGPGERPPVAKLRYELSVHHGALRVERTVVSADGTEAPLAMSLADRVARGVTEPALDPTHDDMAVDRMLLRRLGGDVLLEHVGAVLEALSSADARFGGAPARVSGKPVAPVARLEDAKPGGVTLSIEVPPDVEFVAMGVALAGGELRPLSEGSKFGWRFEKLPLVRTFSPPELGSLAAEVLPELDKTMEVDVRTSRIPRTGKRDRPRASFELTHEHGALHVLPLVVYGDPPRARVDAGQLVMLSRSSRDPVPLRDEPSERALVTRLREELSLVPGRRVRFDGREAAAFAGRLQEFHESTPAAHLHGEAAARRELVPRATWTGAEIELEFELAPVEGEGRGAPRRFASAAAVADAFRAGLPIVALDGGGFAHLPADFLEKHGQAVIDLVSAKSEAGALPRVLLPLAVEVAAALGEAPPPEVDKALALLSNGSLPDPELAPDLTAELRPYQRAGAGWIGFLRQSALGGGVLADDMGLGKTVQVLAVLRGRTLVVCPRSVVHNWASEIARFRPGLRVARYEGQGRALDPTADVTLATYAVLRLDAERLAEAEWESIVLDEAQAIKNPDSQVAQAAFGLRAPLKLCLSGTPVENRLDELWSLLRFAAPGLLGGRRDFAQRYAEPIERGDAAALARLRARTRPFVLRRTKREVLRDLPPRTEAVLYCELSERERALYDAVRLATRQDVIDRIREGGSVLLALEALLRLRQASCHAALLPGQTADTSAKVERLVAALEELAADGHRALVFSQWTSLLDRVEPHLDAAGLAHLRLDGSTRDREAVTRAFQAPSGPPVLLLSLKAGGVGLNLTAADHVFLLDPWWNPAVEEQAADRAHRIGQDKPVMVFRLVAKDTVEEKILELQDRKRRLADAAVGQGAGAGAGITREDLLALLD